ncbi:MAG: hypothetical protein ACLTKQ_07355 [Acutalibacteraceae bacterium]
MKDRTGRALKGGVDYNVSYPKGMKNVGKYTVKVTFKENYSGSKSQTVFRLEQGQERDH